MNTKRFTWLSLSLVLLGQAICATAHRCRRATTISARAAGSASPDKDKGNSDVSEGGFFGRQRFNLTFDTRFGYDDNTLGQPDNGHHRRQSNHAASPW